LGPALAQPSTGEAWTLPTTQAVTMTMTTTTTLPRAVLATCYRHGINQQGVNLYSDTCRLLLTLTSSSPLLSSSSSPATSFRSLRALSTPSRHHQRSSIRLYHHSALNTSSSLMVHRFINDETCYNNHDCSTKQVTSPLALRRFGLLSSSSNDINKYKGYHRTFSSSSSSSGKDQHAFFQQQLLEIEEERRSLLGSLDDDDDNDINLNMSLPEMANQAKVQQQQHLHVVGDAEDEQLLHEQEFNDLEDGSSEELEKQRNVADAPTDEQLEDMKQERELLFQFSHEDRTAWSNVVSSSSISPSSTFGEQQSIQQILAEVERLRALEDTAAGVGREGDQWDAVSSIHSNDGPIRQSPAPTASSQPENQLYQHHESFSHVSSDGTSIHMVDVGSKAVTARTATARTTVWLPPVVMKAFVSKSTRATDTDELIGPKGPIFATAKLAGIMAAKKTSDLIPLCHPLPLDQVKIDIQVDHHNEQTTNGEGSSSGGGIVTIDCTCRVTHKTGVEMEALTGASVAALTIYDMTKAVSHEIVISDTRLISKTGGKRTVGV
jgi:cyclic pyranopterin monophosphate synthase